MTSAAWWRGVYPNCPWLLTSTSYSLISSLTFLRSPSCIKTVFSISLFLYFCISLYFYFLIFWFLYFLYFCIFVFLYISTFWFFDFFIFPSEFPSQYTSMFWVAKLPEISSFVLDGIIREIRVLLRSVP